MTRLAQSQVSMVLLTLVLALASCSGAPSTPGSTEVEKALAEQLATRKCPSEMKLIGAKKINGWEEKEVSGYAVEFSSEIEILQDRPSVKYCYNGDVGIADMTGLRRLKRGERATVKGKMLFRNTESGWKVAAIRVDE